MATLHAVTAETKATPTWIHFGAGNIFRAFQANVCQNLLNDGTLSTGIIAAEGFDYEIIEKRTVVMPEELVGIVMCPNPKCITNNEPMRTRFRSVASGKEIIRCCYCNKDVDLADVRIVE